jgi:hypothetical protein
LFTLLSLLKCRGLIAEVARVIVVNVTAIFLKLFVFPPRKVATVMVKNDLFKANEFEALFSPPVEDLLVLRPVFA